MISAVLKMYYLILQSTLVFRKFRFRTSIYLQDSTTVWTLIEIITPDDRNVITSIRQYQLGEAMPRRFRRETVALLCERRWVNVVSIADFLEAVDCNICFKVNHRGQ